MENNYINQSSLLTNLFLMMTLVLFLICINNHLLCPPPNFILNSDDHAMERCNIQRNQSTCDDFSTNQVKNEFASKSSNVANQNGIDEEVQDSYRFDLLMFSLVLPLGLSSLLMSLSSQWISKAQEWKIFTRIKSLLQIRSISRNPQFYLQIDSLKAIIAILSVVICFVYLTPIGFSVANWTTECFVMPAMCTGFSLLLTPLTILIVYPLDIKASFHCITRRIQKRNDRKGERGNSIDRTSYPDIYRKFFLSLTLCLSSIIVLVFISISLHGSEPFSKDGLSKYHECHTAVLGVAIYLMIAYVIMIISTVLLSIHYSILMPKVCYSGEQRNQNNNENCEEIPLNEKDPEA